MFLHYRVNAYITNGWASAIVNPDGVATVTCTDDTATSVHDLQPLKEIIDSQHPILMFSNSQIITYFVTRTSIDGLPANDLKAINNSAQNLFKCGHVQDIKVANDKHLYIQAKCIPEMKKDRIYKIYFLLDKETLDIMRAECGCPAGKGPHASCKHIAALCYALEEFSRFGKLPDFLTSTEKLQQWNKPRPKKLEIMPVADLTSRKGYILQRKNKSNMNYDPRPLEYRTIGIDTVEELRCNLLSLNQPSAFLDILVPSKEKVKHDHTYSLPPEMYVDIEVTKEVVSGRLPSYPLDDHEFKESCFRMKRSLNVLGKERKRIEMETRDQSLQDLWHVVRSKRITGSKCGRILCQRSKTVSLLRQCVYPTPTPVAWGIQHEPIAIKKYISYKKDTVLVEKCGFVIHPEKGWLGASPDGKVKDLTSQHAQPSGLIEVKCPYTKRDCTPEEACSDDKFCCQIVNSFVKLKHDHIYYHQVQLQLYTVCKEYDWCQWCDFCIFTSKGISVERIFPDKDWEQKYIPELEIYFDENIAPELISAKYKPAYVL